MVLLMSLFSLDLRTHHVCLYDVHVIWCCSKKNGFELLIALDENESAEGDWYLDDGESAGIRI